MSASHSPASHTQTIHRVEVRPRPGCVDVRGSSLLKRVIADGGVNARVIDYAQVYLISGELNQSDLLFISQQLLADPVTQIAFAGTSAQPKSGCTIEVHPLAGVTDPAAESVELAVEKLVGKVVQVRTGERWDFHGATKAQGETIAEK